MRETEAVESDSMVTIPPPKAVTKNHPSLLPHYPPPQHIYIFCHHPHEVNRLCVRMVTDSFPPLGGAVTDVATGLGLDFASTCCDCPRVEEGRS